MEQDGRPDIFDPYACVVGCSGCASQCPAKAISFPSLVELRDTLVTLRKKYHVGLQVIPCQTKLEPV